MGLRELYETLFQKFGTRSDPETWWPVYLARTHPPAFERVITNVLVTQSRWPIVNRAIHVLDEKGFLTARGLAEGDSEEIAECIKPTGFQSQKAKLLKAIGVFVVDRFGAEQDFCEQATRADLLGVQGIGEETADRILLYTCYRKAWPVDTYCKRVLAHHGVIPAVPTKPADRRRVAASIKDMVDREIPATVGDWQRLHALMQLEGESLPRPPRGGARD